MVIGAKGHLGPHRLRRDSAGLREDWTAIQKAGKAAKTENVGGPQSVKTFLFASGKSLYPLMAPAVAWGHAESC